MNSRQRLGAWKALAIVRAFRLFSSGPMRGIFAAFAVLACLTLVTASTVEARQPYPPSHAPAQTTAPTSASNPLIQIMQQELQRALSGLAHSTPKPYFISYSVDDHQNAMVLAEHGALFASSIARRRQLDVSIRVGSPKLDNTDDGGRVSGLLANRLPIQDDQGAIAHVLWETTYREYKRAAAEYLQVETNHSVEAQPDDLPDFSSEPPHVSIGDPAPPLQFDKAHWESLVRGYSALFNKYPQVLNSIVLLSLDSSTLYFVSSEGTRVVTSEPIARLSIVGEARADDGMELTQTKSFDAADPAHLPDEQQIDAAIQKVAEELIELRKAPVVEPYSGPALLSGRAAAVFFHEVLGHRVEGHRQRGSEEGQTFAKKIGQMVLPPFLTVVDDPLQTEVNGIRLSGQYQFDSEGVPAQRVVVVQNGILRNFLMSRMPVKGFSTSNGHGRAQDGLMPEGRQGNLIVTSTKTIPDGRLMGRLISEIRKQKKPYGLYFEDISGGLTLTRRTEPQAFKVIPVIVWKIFPDGRKPELVRGVDIVGTPLDALTKIVVTGDTEHVFDGECGAESGSIPVSAVAPAMLFSQIEVQKKAQGHNRPPILPPPSPVGN
jgi:TldD protein